MSNEITGFEKNLDAVIKLKRGRLSDLSVSDEIYAEGEPIIGFFEHGSILKIGDGIHTWAQLPNLGVDATNINYYDLTTEENIKSLIIEKNGNININNNLTETINDNIIQLILTAGFDKELLQLFENEGLIQSGKSYRIKYNYNELNIFETRLDGPDEVLEEDEQELQEEEDNCGHYGLLEFYGHIQTLTTATNKKYTRQKNIPSTSENDLIGNENEIDEWNDFQITNWDASAIQAKLYSLGNAIIESVELGDEINTKIMGLTGTIEQIKTTLPDNKAIESYIERTANKEVKRFTQRNLNDLTTTQTELVQSIDGITATAQQLEEDIVNQQAQLEITAEAIRSEVADFAEQTSTLIEQLDDEIRLKVTTDEAESMIDQKANQIELSVKNTKSLIESKMTFMEDKILQTVSNKDESLYAQIQVELDKIQSRVYNAEQQMESRIEQKANEINLEVRNLQANTPTVAQIQAIFEDEIGKVKLTASQIELNGLVSAGPDNERNFIISEDGVLHLMKGSIGGWNIEDNALTADSSGISYITENGVVKAVDNSFYDLLESTYLGDQCYEINTSLYENLQESNKSIQVIPNQRNKVTIQHTQYEFGMHINVTYFRDNSNSNAEFIVLDEDVNVTYGGVPHCYPFVVKNNNQTYSLYGYCEGNIYKFIRMTNNQIYTGDRYILEKVTNTSDLNIYIPLDVQVNYLYQNISRDIYNDPSREKPLNYVLKYELTTVPGSRTYISAYSQDETKPIISIGVPNIVDKERIDINQGKIKMFANGDMYVQKLTIKNKDIHTIIDDKINMAQSIIHSGFITTNHLSSSSDFYIYDFTNEKHTVKLAEYIIAVLLEATKETDLQTTILNNTNTNTFINTTVENIIEEHCNFASNNNFTDFK